MDDMFSFNPDSNASLTTIPYLLDQTPSLLTCTLTATRLPQCERFKFPDKELEDNNKLERELKLLDCCWQNSIGTVP